MDNKTRDGDGNEGITVIYHGDGATIVSHDDWRVRIREYGRALGITDDIVERTIREAERRAAKINE